MIPATRLGSGSKADHIVDVFYEVNRAPPRDLARPMKQSRSFATLPVDTGGDQMRPVRSAFLSLGASVFLSTHLLNAQTPCININDCTGGRYAVMWDRTLADPAVGPTHSAGATTGGWCSSADTYRTYITWCNESGCTALSPQSTSPDLQPPAGTANLINVTRPSIPASATSWSAFFSKASESHTKFRHCSSMNPLVGTDLASVDTIACKCFPPGGQLQSSNATGVVQTNKLQDDGTIRFSSKDGTVQAKLTPEKAVLDFTTDLVPRFSPNSGTTFRTVDWNSATVYYVDPTIGASGTAPVGRTVFNALYLALGAITDSGPSKPYVIKLRTNGGSVLTGGIINKPYVWVQGDGAARISDLTVCADGVRVTQVISTGLRVGTDCGTLVDDPTDVYVADNVVYNPQANSCTAYWLLGRAGTGRLNTITFTNNDLGRYPGGASAHCALNVGFMPGTARTHVYITNNTWHAMNPIHGKEHIDAYLYGDYNGVAPHVELWSIGNRFIGSIAPGVDDPGEFFSCIALEGGVGAITSMNDTCVLYRSDNTADNEDFMFFQVDLDYAGSLLRRVTLVNPTLEVSLPAAEVGDDMVGLFNVDSPNLDLRIINPTLRAELGPGFDPSTDLYFGRVDGGRSTPPNPANTFIRYSGVVNVPSGAIFENNSPAYSFGPLEHILPESFAAGLRLKGEDLGSSCSVNEMRFDIVGTKELCICEPANTWNCAALSALQD